MDESDEMTLEQAADALGVSMSKLHRMAKDGLLVKHKRLYGRGIGGRRMFVLRADVEALARGEVPAPAPVAAPAPKVKKRKGN